MPALRKCMRCRFGALEGSEGRLAKVTRMVASLYISNEHGD